MRWWPSATPARSAQEIANRNAATFLLPLPRTNIAYQILDSEKPLKTSCFQGLCLVAGTCKRVCYNFWPRRTPTASSKIENGRQLAA